MPNVGIQNQVEEESKLWSQSRILTSSSIPGPRMDDTVGNSCETYFSLQRCQEIDVQCHKLRQNGWFVSKYPSSVATILQSHVQVQLLNLNLNPIFDVAWSCIRSRHQISEVVPRLRPKLNYGAGRDFGVGPEFGATRKQPIIPGNSRARLCAGEEDRVTWPDLRPG